MNRILDERDKDELVYEIQSSNSLRRQEIEILRKDTDEAITELDDRLTQDITDLDNELTQDIKDLDNKVATNLSNLDKKVDAKDTELSNNITALAEDTTNKLDALEEDTANKLNALETNLKSYSDSNKDSVVDNAPENMDTLYEISASLGDDPDFAGTMNTKISNHTSNISNPHKVTASQVGLGNVPNVATNDQTPTYTEASALSNIVSGEKLSISFGKIMKAISDLISHIGNKLNPHAVTKAQVGLGNADNTSDINKPVSTAQNTAILNAKTEVQNNLNTHKADISNPHSVTAHQVGAYTQSETDAKIASLIDSAPETLNTLNELAAALGDDNNFATTMSTELGKKATKDEFNEHKEDDSNPHSVTKAQVGLGSVDNTSDAAKPVSTAQATAIADAKKAGTDAQNTIDSHIGNKENPHNVTASQVGADALGSAAKALADAKNYTNSQLEFEMETIRTLFSDRIDMLETRIKPLPTISTADEGKVLCVVNGSYSLVSITDLITKEEPVS